MEVIVPLVILFFRLVTVFIPHALDDLAEGPPPELTSKRNVPCCIYERRHECRIRKQ